MSQPEIKFHFIVSDKASAFRLTISIPCAPGNSYRDTLTLILQVNVIYASNELIYCLVLNVQRKHSLPIRSCPLSFVSVFFWLDSCYMVEN